MARITRKKTKAKKPAAKAARTKAAGRATGKRTAAAKARASARGKRPARKAGAAPTSGSAMRALAQHIVDVSLGHDDEGILALYARDIESSEAGQPPQVGIDALRAKFAGWRAMTTDNVFEPRRVLVDGDTIVIEWLGRVTLAASGRQAELHEIAVHEIRDGKIVREAFFYNPAALAG